MRSLNECIIESLLDDEDEVFDGAKESIIKEFLETNYKIAGSYIIKEVKGRFIVDVKGGMGVANKNIELLTNGLFDFGVISGDFICHDCQSLASLTGAPKEVGGRFSCNWCASLKSLEGAPKEVGGNFECGYCDLLTSLEGAPKKVGGEFCCNDCGAKFKTMDIKKYTKGTKYIRV